MFSKRYRQDRPTLQQTAKEHLTSISESDARIIERITDQWKRIFRRTEKDMLGKIAIPPHLESALTDSILRRRFFISQQANNQCPCPVCRLRHLLDSIAALPVLIVITEEQTP